MTTIFGLAPGYRIRNFIFGCDRRKPSLRGNAVTRSSAYALPIHSQGSGTVSAEDIKLSKARSSLNGPTDTRISDSDSESSLEELYRRSSEPVSWDRGLLVSAIVCPFRKPRVTSLHFPSSDKPISPISDSQRRASEESYLVSPFGIFSRLSEVNSAAVQMQTSITDKMQYFYYHISNYVPEVLCSMPGFQKPKASLGSSSFGQKNKDTIMHGAYIYRDSATTLKCPECGYTAPDSSHFVRRRFSLPSGDSTRSFQLIPATSFRLDNDDVCSSRRPVRTARIPGAEVYDCRAGPEKSLLNIDPTVCKNQETTASDCCGVNNAASPASPGVLSSVSAATSRKMSLLKDTLQDLQSVLENAMVDAFNFDGDWVDRDEHLASSLDAMWEVYTSVPVDMDKQNSSTVSTHIGFFSNNYIPASLATEFDISYAGPQTKRSQSTSTADHFLADNAELVALLESIWVTTTGETVENPHAERRASGDSRLLEPDGASGGHLGAATNRWPSAKLSSGACPATVVSPTSQLEIKKLVERFSRLDSYCEELSQLEVSSASEFEADNSAVESPLSPQLFALSESVSDIGDWYWVLLQSSLRRDCNSSREIVMTSEDCSYFSALSHALDGISLSTRSLQLSIVASCFAVIQDVEDAGAFANDPPNFDRSKFTPAQLGEVTTRLDKFLSALYFLELTSALNLRGQVFWSARHAETAVSTLFTLGLESVIFSLFVFPLLDLAGSVHPATNIVPKVVSGNVKPELDVLGSSVALSLLIMSCCNPEWLPSAVLLVAHSLNLCLTNQKTGRPSDWLSEWSLTTPAAHSIRSGHLPVAVNSCLRVLDELTRQTIHSGTPPSAGSISEDSSEGVFLILLYPLIQV